MSYDDAATYTPKRGCLAGKVLAFFAANPDEELSSFDIASKYGINPPNDVSERMVPLVKMGLLSPIKRGKFRHYIAGDRMPAWAGNRINIARNGS